MVYMPNAETQIIKKIYYYMEINCYNIRFGTALGEFTV